MSDEEQLSTLRDWESFAKIPYPRCTDAQAMDYDDLSNYSQLPANPDVTVIVLAYNHGKWIRDCLDSLVNQETLYSYEILVSEDGSSDNTRAVCMEYQARYPAMIRLFAARHNYRGLGNGGVGGRVVRAVVDHSRYVMWCEGDDYWVDEHKIEKQVSLLESRHDVDACVARFNTFYVRENLLDRTQETLGGDFIQHVFKNGFAFYHISTICVRQCAYQAYVEYAKKIGVAYDMTLLLTLELGRGIYVMHGIVSVYRSTGEGIWSSCSANSMRAQHHRTLTVNALATKFPASIYMYAALINGYWQYARIDFWQKRDWGAMLLALLRMVQYSLRSPLSVGYCARFFVWPKVLDKLRKLV